MQVANDLVKAFHICWRELDLVDELRLMTMYAVLPALFAVASDAMQKIQAQVQSGDQSTRAMQTLVKTRDKFLGHLMLAGVWVQDMSRWTNQMSEQVEAMFEFVKNQLFLADCRNTQSGHSRSSSAKSLSSICLFELHPDRRDDALSFLILFFSSIDYKLCQSKIDDPSSQLEHVPEPTLMRLANLSTLPNGEQKTLWQQLLDLRERELLLGDASSDFAERIQNLLTLCHLYALRDDPECARLNEV
jgi:hypothetical protein